VAPAPRRPPKQFSPRPGLRLHLCSGSV
jgi:hypothetical protein